MSTTNAASMACQSLTSESGVGSTALIQPIAPPVEGEHLTQRQYELECVLKAQRTAYEQDQRIRDAQRRYEAQQGVSTMAVQALTLHMTVQILAGGCTWR